MKILDIQTQSPQLGRLVSFDPRDMNHRMSLPTAPVEIYKRYWNSNQWWGDQGQTSQCVAYGWLHWLEDGPVTHKNVPPPILDPTFLYNECQKNDEWQGENYDGTSVRAGAKVLQSLGLISSYEWAWDLPTVIKCLLTKGPVVVGTNWYTSMFYPDANGLIKISGIVEGGHCTKWDGINTRKKLIRGKNSWGRNFGDNGHYWISFDDAARLLAEYGECCLAVENKT